MPQDKKLVKKHELRSPIIDGRLVDSYTFATRFVNFLKDIEVRDCGSEEELEYLQSVAAKLLTYQMATVSDENEKNYFRNLGYKII